MLTYNKATENLLNVFIYSAGKVKYKGPPANLSNITNLRF